MMKSSGASINDRDTYFRFPELKRIHSEPTPDTLLNLKIQIKANATSLPSNLRDRLHGHLGLAISNNKYALISNAPFISPMHPGPLTIPPRITSALAIVLKETHQ